MTASTTSSATRTSSWSRPSRSGLKTTGYRCGPLNEREAAVGWLASKVRADLAAAGGAPLSDRSGTATAASNGENGAGSGGAG